jgi:hypothetical protein
MLLKDATFIISRKDKLSSLSFVLQEDIDKWSVSGGNIFIYDISGAKARS